MSCLGDWVGRPALDVAALGSGQWPQLKERLSDQFISVQMARVFLNITRSCDSSHLDFQLSSPQSHFASTGFPEGPLTLLFSLFFLVPLLWAFQPEAESLGKGQASTAWQVTWSHKDSHG